MKIERKGQRAAVHPSQLNGGDTFQFPGRAKVYILCMHRPGQRTQFMDPCDGEIFDFSGDVAVSPVVAKLVVE